MFVANDREFGVTDPQQSRITFFSNDGKISRIIADRRSQGDLNSLCHANNRALLAIHLPEFSIRDLSQDSNPVVVDSITWPVPEFNEAAELRQGRFARSRNGKCIVYQGKGDFFFLYSDDNLAQRTYHQYVTDFPKPTIDKRNRFPRALGVKGVAQDAAVYEDTLFVLRAVQQSDSSSIVDMYSITSGAHLCSLVLPNDAFKIDVGTDLIVVLRASESGSIVSVFDRRMRSGAPC